MAKETKTELIQLRVTGSMKTQVERAAKAQGRSVANYIEWLITQDIALQGKDKR